MTFNGLRALYSLSKGVLGVVGPLVNRIGSVGIKSFIPLQILQSVSGHRNQRERMYRATPIGWEVIHGGSRRERASAFSSGNVTSLRQL